MRQKHRFKKGGSSFALFITILMLFFLSGSSGTTQCRAEESDFMNAFIERLQRNHPVLTCQDVYKALFQYSNGMEHLLTDEEGARQYLRKEISALSPGDMPDEKLVEFLSDDLSVCRINLRPFVAHGGDPEKLAHVFFLSGKEFRKEPEKFIMLWKSFLQAVDRGKYPFDKEEAHQIDEEGQKSHYEENVNHSATYRERYKPAYRVILTKHLEKLF